jgi:hypothetical protein
MERHMATQHYPFPRESSFDPESIRVMTNAFEEAWASLNDTGTRLGSRGFSAETVREMLAKCIIQMAKAGVRDQQRLRDAALEHLAQSRARNVSGKARMSTEEPCSPKKE